MSKSRSSSPYRGLPWPPAAACSRVSPRPRFIAVHEKEEGRMSFLNFAFVTAIEPLARAEFPAAARLYFAEDRSPLDVRETAKELLAQLAS